MQSRSLIDTSMMSSAAKMPALPIEVTAVLARLPLMSVTELRAEWRRLYRSWPPAKLRRHTLELAVGWQLQARALGGLPKAVQRQLDEAAAQLTTGSAPRRPRRVALKQGAQLVREWGGETVEVLVVEGGYVWRDRQWASLSAIARAVTGVRWSGPRFFGVAGAAVAKRRGLTGEGAGAAK